ncbi:MAG: SHOCT domain-containing protein [Bacteroidaceae bacterium]|nr:SHOCT domain-containing protein [Bacteroidaceae bacterium]
MNTLGHLEKMLMAGEISEEEYKERKAVYVETILEMYVMGILTKEQMQERLNQ